jgi:hypothetical protein
MRPSSDPKMGPEAPLAFKAPALYRASGMAVREVSS